MDLNGCSALITGASAGLGAEFVRQLAPRAARLILVARRRERLETLAAEIARAGLEVRCFVVDLGDRKALDQFLAELAAADPEISLLINNAGCGEHGLFEESAWGRVQAMLAVNIDALTRVTHALVPQLVAQGSGAIRNVSSIASLLPLPQMAVYAASKAYVTSFSEALRAELRGTGVHVTALCPGPVDTEFFTIAERPNSDASQAAPDIMKISAEEVVRTGIAALDANRPRVVPGWFVRGVMTAADLAPMFVKRFFLNRRGRGFTGH